MPEIIVSQVTEIDNPELREIATRVLNTMQLAAEKATAHQAEPATYPISSDPDSFEQLFSSRFQQLRPEQQQAGITNVMAAIEAPEAERIRVYGDLAKVDLRSPIAVEVQANNSPLSDSLQFSQSETNNLLEFPSQVSSRGTAGLTHTLELRIHRVKCVEETSGWGGRDEIDLGGNTIDESGNSENISAFRVGKFDDGDEVNYSPPRIFTTFDLLKYPGILGARSYFVTLALAEIDSGGFSDFLNKLLEKVKEEVIKALTPIATALGTTIGAMIGSGIPILGTAIGAAIGAIVGWVVGKVFEWLKSWWGDEIFAPFTVSANIPSLDARWNGNTESPQGEVSFKDHGGEYRLYYDWRIEVPPTNWAVMGNELISGVGVSSWKPEVMDLFVRGTDNLLYYKWYDSNNGGWMQGYEQLGLGQISFSPVAVSGGGSDLIDVFARGIGASDGVYHKVWQSNVWSDWQRLGSMDTLSGPGLSREPGRYLGVFVRGTDNALYAYQYNPNDGWVGPWPLDGQISSSPAAIALINGPVHVFARGTDNALWHRWYDNGWQNWESLGGPLDGQISSDPESGPSVCSWGERRLDVFVRGTDNAVWHRWSYDGGVRWENWESLGGVVTSSPASISRASNLIEVFVRGTDSKLYHRWWDGTAWRP